MLCTHFVSLSVLLCTFLTVHRVVCAASLYISLILFCTLGFYCSNNDHDVDHEVFMSKWNMICSKIDVRVTLEKCGSTPMVNVRIKNAHLKHPMALVHLLWINLYEHKIVTMNHFPEKITLSSGK